MAAKRHHPPSSHLQPQIYVIYLNYPEIRVRGDQFLHYQQLKTLFKSKMKLTNNTLHHSKTSEQVLDIADHPKKSISKLYKLISSSNPTITLPKANGNVIWHYPLETNLQKHQLATHTIQNHSQNSLGSTDTYFHATWLCQPVHSLWTTVTETVFMVLDCRVPLSPTLCL